MTILTITFLSKLMNMIIEGKNLENIIQKLNLEKAK